MNVLFVDQFSDLGGAQRCLLDLMPAVQQAGWKAHAALPGEGALVPRLRGMGVSVQPISCGTYSLGRKSLADAWRYSLELAPLAKAIRQLARSANADLLYVNGPRLLPAAAWAARGRWPLLFHCHSHIPQRTAAWLAGCSLRWTNATVVSCCEFSVSRLKRHTAAPLLHLVENGVAPPASINERTQSEEFRIGMVGRLSPAKGQAEFLRAARLLTQVLPRCRFLIAGDALFDDPAAQSYRGHLEQLASGLPVEFVGWRDDVYEFLSGLDLLAVPSTDEPGAPRVILEAFAAGVPVIAFPSGGIPEIVTDGETGFLVSPATPQALAQRILVLRLRQPQLLQSVARTARAGWEQRFSLDRYQRRILAIMDHAASNGTIERPSATAGGEG